MGHYHFILTSASTRNEFSVSAVFDLGDTHVDTLTDGECWWVIVNVTLTLNVVDLERCRLVTASGTR